MRIALIYPPFYHKKFNENLPTVDDEFGIFPHIGFGWVAAAIKEAGHEVKLFDAAASKCDYKVVLNDVKEYNPDILGFAAHAVQTFRDMLLWANKFKIDTKLPILVGGYEAKIYPYEIMEHNCFDFLCVGEANTFMAPFLKAFEAGKGYENVPDLVYRKNGIIRKTLDAPHVPFNEHHHPDRSIFDHTLYYSHVSTHKNFTIGMSEVGCPYPCSFCSMRHTGFDARSPIRIADEMQECVEKYNIHEIDWFDPVMLHDRVRIIELSKELKWRKLDMIWSARARIDSLTYRKANGKIDEELLQALSDSGCKRLFFGIESGDDEILKNIKKGTKTNGMKNVLDAAKAYGIRPLGFFMIGNTGETKETVNKTIKLSKMLPLDYAQFTITIMKPHTELEKELIKKTNGLDYWREYVRGNVEERVLPTPWTELSRAEMEKYARKAYLSFYLRPKYIFYMLKQLRSFSELKRYVRVFFQLLLRPIRPQPGKDIPAVLKVTRTIMAFLEGCFASLNNAARHPVAAYGGGIKGAYQLAKHEWIRSKTLKDMPSPGNIEKEVRQFIPLNSVNIKIVNHNDHPARYIPVTSGSLGVPKLKKEIEAVELG